MVYYSDRSTPLVESVPSQSLSPAQNEIPQTITISEAVVLPNHPGKFSKQQIRTSLKASTWDAAFAAIFTSITSGVLLSNLLLQLGADSMQLGVMFSIPMLMNLLQPVGAYLSSLTTSRRWYGFCVYSVSRLLWLVLAIAIWLSDGSDNSKHFLLQLTFGLVLVSALVGALGNASWLSWMAWLVPERLRGRYFGIRSSASSLVTLLCLPLVGTIASAWPGGTLQAYAVILLVGAITGLISMCCQFLFMTDVNPQWERVAQEWVSEKTPESSSPIDKNFLIFLFYFGSWCLAANVSSPFFNVYLLENLKIDVTLAATYSSLMSGTNLLTTVMWGKVADRIGNRPILLLAGLVVASVPFLWLPTSNNAFSVWVWLPFIYLLMGAAWSGINLCTNNIQMSLAPTKNKAAYFGYAAAAAGIGGALGTTLAGFLAQQANFGGLLGVFILSGVLRYASLIPLLFVSEQGSQSSREVLQRLGQSIQVSFQLKPSVVVIPAELADRSK